MAELVDAWVADFGEWDDLAWDPELTAERLYALLCWGRPAFEQGDPQTRADLLRSAARQARLLMAAQSELSERHLGSIKAGAALVLAAAAGFPDAERLAEQGEEMLIEACAKQFFLDGGHHSRAPEATAEALYDLIVARELLADPPPIFDETLPKLANMVRMLRLGDGGLCCFHGGSEASAVSLEAALSRVRGGERFFQFASTAPISVSKRAARADGCGRRAAYYYSGARASALAFELSSGTEQLIINVGARASRPRAWPRHQRPFHACARVRLLGAGRARHSSPRAPCRPQSRDVPRLRRKQRHRAEPP